MVLFGGCYLGAVNGDFNYKEALTKSILFFEAQRSGKLPPNQRLSWRGDSALQDGKLANVDLVGGYYDAGDNVKYGLPMAFTVTTLSWAAIFYESELKVAGELGNIRDAIRWGTDYFLKASSRRDRLYVQVGNPVADHECWIRPENMKGERSVLQIDESNPGTEIAAETSAAMAAASIVFRDFDRSYARQLLNKAKLDELLWAATWLYTATRKRNYLEYIEEDSISAKVAEFNWDLKYAGAQVLLSKLYWEGQKSLETFNQQADSFICSVLPDSPYHQVYFSPGGLLYLRDGANTQYVTGAAFLFSVYSDLLAKHNQQVTCGNKQFNSANLMAFAKKQMDYLLGKNPKGRSYMVGFGQNPPEQAHHRGASVPKLSTKDAAAVNCPMSFVYWFSKNAPNPNELTGAIVGGPDRYDNFQDQRTNSSMTEPTTYINSMAVGILAKLATSHARLPGPEVEDHRVLFSNSLKQS
ncbi:cellulase [Sarracenia purpurea var. burkii]